MSKITATTSPASSETLTSIAFALAVMRDAVKAEGQAAHALEKRRGASWAAVQEAAAVFPVTMSEGDKTKLSGQLAIEYATYYPATSAKVVASQHARAIYLIATGSSPEGHSNIADFIKAHGKARTGGAATGAQKPAEGEETGQVAPTPAPAKPAALAGVSIELGSAFARLAEMARKNPQIEDAVLLAANRPDEFVAAMEAMLLAPKARKPDVSTMAGQLAAKFGGQAAA